MANELVRQYKVDFDKANNVYIESSSGSMPVIEFIGDDITQRAITVSNINNLKESTFRIIIEHQTYINGTWKTSEEYKNALASKKTFIRESDGLPVTKIEAFETENDLNKEIFDTSNPETPISFEPKRYIQQEVLKDGYYIESDKILSDFSPILFPFFNFIMFRNYEIVTV